MEENFLQNIQALEVWQQIYKNDYDNKKNDKREYKDRRKTQTNRKE